MNFVEKEDPAVWSAIAAEIERQEDGLEMIASENYTSPAVMQAVGSVLTNKYAEGLSRPALLRRLPVRRHRRRSGPRPCQETLRRRACQRAAPLGQPGQPVRLSHGARAGRHRAGAGPGARRPSDARHEAEHLGQAVSLLELRRDAARIIASTSTRWRGWPESTSRR